jgi:type IV secretion system protein VirB8
MAAALDADSLAGTVESEVQNDRATVDAARKDNFAWEIDRAEALSRSERRAWRHAAGAYVLAAMAVAAVLVQGSLRTVETVALVVDKATGETTVAKRLDAETIPVADALDMHTVATYVTARESYHWTFLQHDYDQVARMSTPEVFAPYNAKFQGEDSLDKKMKSSGSIDVNVVSIRLPPESRRGNTGEAVVTFEVLTRLPNMPGIDTKRWIATVRYQYRPKLMMKEADRIENPFGFVALAYRSDPELVPPPAAAATGSTR